VTTHGASAGKAGETGVSNAACIDDRR
jgi:hypothetical protein